MPLDMDSRPHPTDRQWFVGERSPRRIIGLPFQARIGIDLEISPFPGHHADRRAAALLCDVGEFVGQQCSIRRLRIVLAVAESILVI
ncbi:hypothetical protein C487_07302 [Natrinema pallidum DSM 3751]|uniref:Uncharacterized protein n=1 Tax=Natrinema pallidum DSM 3751 TaxID=1227495 RepID=L9YX02_9EURY|nr:hypothetical protein C487_07302 [Natrinema pallidum DSM 3751]